MSEISKNYQTARYAHDVVSVKDFGAIGDGSTNDRASLVAADAAGDFILPAGSYVVTTSVTISNKIELQPGAFLIPSSGATITLSQTPSAQPDEPHFAGGGDVVISDYGQVWANWWTGQTSTTPIANFAARWNEMWANCANAKDCRISGPQTFTSPLNLSGWNNSSNAYRLCHGGWAQHTINHTGDVAIDTTDSRYIRMRAWDCLQSTNSPKVGLLRARSTADTGIGPAHFEHVRIRGTYTVATLVSSMAERQSWNKCVFNNSGAYPARILTNEPMGNFTVASTFQTVSTTTVLSGNGQHFMDCSAQNDDGAQTTVTTGNVGMTTLIRGDGGHRFDNDYQKGNGFAAYHIDTESNGDVIGVKIDNAWIEDQGGTHPKYIVSAYGSGDSTDTCTDLDIDIFSSAPVTADLFMSGVGRIRGLQFRGAHRSEGNVNHGCVIMSSGPVDGHGIYLANGNAGDIDFSGVNHASSEISGRIDVIDTADFIPPTLTGALNVSVHSGTGGVEVLQDSGTIADADATPDLSGYDVWVTANTGATTITDLDGIVTGAVQQKTIVFGDANTTIDFTGTDLRGNAGVDWTPAVGDHMVCTLVGTTWYCTVSDNTA